ncbi:MAG: hypothetical protein M1438_19940 [Deltaproteobacteria bacterium]|nr:hypothetical protein [Deltaproteobacteria bacterium]
MTGRKESAYFAEAERLYVQENQTLEQIREMLHQAVSLTTLSGWKQKGGWERKREVVLTAPKDMAGRLRSNLLRQIEALEGESRLDPAAYDAIYKTFLLLEKLEKAQDLRTLTIPVMEAYRDYLRGLALPAREMQLHAERLRDFFRSLE